MARLAWPSFSMKTVLAVQVALIFTALMWGVTWLIEGRMLSATQAMVLEQQATLARNTVGQVRQQLLVRQRALLLAAPALGALQPEPVAAQAMMDVQRGLLGAFDSVELVRAGDQRVLARLPAQAGRIGARLPPLDVVRQTLLSQRGMVSQPLRRRCLVIDASNYRRWRYCRKYAAFHCPDCCSSPCLTDAE